MVMISCCLPLAAGELEMTLNTMPTKARVELGGGYIGVRCEEKEFSLREVTARCHSALSSTLNGRSTTPSSSLNRCSIGTGSVASYPMRDSSQRTQSGSKTKR